MTNLDLLICAKTAILEHPSADGSPCALYPSGERGLDR